MHRLTPAEKWEQAGLENNFIFYKVMRNNPELCRHLLEILLEMKIDRIVIHEEDTIIIDYDSKGIRLDVYAHNATEAFDLEMQTADTKELPERARYYQGIMDVDMLKSGQHYRELKTSYIVFICMNDIFGGGLPVYTFENLCRQKNSIALNDRTFKYFFIAKNCDKLLNKEQKEFFKLVTANQADNAFTKSIQRQVTLAKHNTQWRKEYMDFERYILYERDDAEEKAIARNSREIALNMLKYNDPVDKVSKITNLPLEVVLQLAKENNIEIKEASESN